MIILDVLRVLGSVALLVCSIVCIAAIRQGQVRRRLLAFRRMLVNRVREPWVPGQITAQAFHDILQNGDRRASNRMAIERDVHYKVLGVKKNIVKQAGFGRTLNMSRGGMLFTTETAIAPGERIQVSVSWPAQLRGVIPLKLVAFGRVIRAEDGQAAIVIEKHEFKAVGIRGL